jgi:hypothetical protein
MLPEAVSESEADPLPIIDPDVDADIDPLPIIDAD